MFVPLRLYTNIQWTQNRTYWPSDNTLCVNSPFTSDKRTINKESNFVLCWCIYLRNLETMEFKSKKRFITN